jgi:hypothetical protein
MLSGRTIYVKNWAAAAAKSNASPRSARLRAEKPTAAVGGKKSEGSRADGQKIQIAPRNLVRSWFAKPVLRRASL